ncbi:thiamine ABC transporter substrate binding subunit [Providencia vermicola]|uniref:Thiamine-binding periplasmic protein n=1 Tax=Providencia vermicola TaxID=333965 RepID=A0AAX3RTR8_9GAMM|nr:MULTISPECIES: thiamine ABC transporter substrate binding subunit [Providencia]ELX8377614.1 thiamine ABC transporter substrate binding subunit [Providencia stuartii]EMD5257155.1 thiamine ABC transporter substrate binding subunit [Providencia stuartii]USB37140.1 thiamine ABC transporter substrate binding subunit [Providencia vermicola]WFC06072.1 thiamine ABC transporter substrate binding subunit [Providencia vermicola]
MLKNSLFRSLLAFTTLSLAHFAWAEKPTLTVYTYDSFAAEWGPGPQIKKNFEAQCGCELKLMSLGDGVALLNRLRMEGKKTKADIVLGLDNNLIVSAEETGLFAPADINTDTMKLPIAWDNTTFIPYDYGYFAFIYDTNKIKNPPKSMSELLDSTQPWKIIYQDPRTSTPGLGLMLWIEKLYGDKSADAWQKMASKTLTVTKGWSESYGLFLKGEGDFVLSYTSSPGYQILNDNKDNYAAALFDEGHYMQIEVAARLKTSSQPELAKQFLAFMLTPEFQSTLPTTNWMYPVIDIPLPDVYKVLPMPKKSLQFSAQEVAKERQSWIRLWQSAVSR